MCHYWCFTSGIHCAHPEIASTFNLMILTSVRHQRISQSRAKYGSSTVHFAQTVNEITGHLIQAVFTTTRRFNEFSASDSTSKLSQRGVCARHQRIPPDTRCHLVSHNSWDVTLSGTRRAASSHLMFHTSNQSLGDIFGYSRTKMAGANTQHKPPQFLSAICSKFFLVFSF